MTSMITTKTTSTYNATIYVGSKFGYSDDVIEYSVAEDLIQEWTDRVGQCVTLTRTNYIYTNGSEYGIIVGFINYPRFPSTPEIIRSQAMELANILLTGLKQMNISVVFPDETVMLSDLDRIVEIKASEG